MNQGLTIEQKFSFEKYKREVESITERPVLIEYIETVQKLNQRKIELLFEMFSVIVILPKNKIKLEAASLKTLRNILNEGLLFSIQMDSHVKELSRR